MKMNVNKDVEFNVDMEIKVDMNMDMYMDVNMDMDMDMEIVSLPALQSEKLVPQILLMPRGLLDRSTAR